MPIQVVCPGCKQRFSVSETFAGKQGPCPKCKEIIKIPDKAAEVTIHGPDASGPAGTKAGSKTATGQPTFKPIRRTDLKASPVMIMSVVGGIVVTLLAALVIRMGTTPENPVNWVILAFGAILLAVPMAWGGYVFIRDPELAPYRGKTLYIRVGICAAVFALLWGAWAILRPLWGFAPGPIDLPWLVIIVPSLVAAGAIAPFATLYLEYGTAALHYGLYLAVCVLLRVIMHLPPF